jgi:hypothetical protein
MNTKKVRTTEPKVQREARKAVRAARTPKKKPTEESQTNSAPFCYIPERKDPMITVETKLFEWKNLIPAKYVDIGNEWLSQNGIELKGVTDEQKEELKERCGEENLIIKLAGFKHLAHLRGMSYVDYDIKHVSEKHVSATCTIAFDSVSVTDKDGTVYNFPKSTISGIANATESNTSYPYSMFLESMAENRSFIRAIKTAFNINILGAEELKIQAATTPNMLEGEEGCASPQDSLRMAVQGKGKDFSDLRESLKKKKWEGYEAWNDFSDIPAEQCFLIITSIITKK